MRDVPTRFLLPILAVLAGWGCDKGQAPAPQNSAAPAEPDHPRTLAQADELLKRGANFWNSPATVRDDRQEWTGGQRFRIWPDEQGTVKGSNGALHIRFRWMLGDGQAPPGEHGKDDIVGTVAFLSEGNIQVPATRDGVITESRVRSDLEQGAKEGVLSFKMDFRNKGIRGEGWVLFYLGEVRRRLPDGGRLRPDSNLLRILVRFD